ncbi:MAG: hypothetical protein J6A61_07180 [Clostridia bacterium]|nr:hypothetical protein [Clostridia bacterium]
MKKGDYLRLWQNIGIVLGVIGFLIFFILKREVLGPVIVVIGAVISIIPGFFGKYVYICPQCQTKFREIDDKIVVQSNFHLKGFALLTCPKCKKTNFMRLKLISKEEFHKS